MTGPVATSGGGNDTPAPPIGRRFMVALVAASILNPMNTSSLATALASIARDMHVTAAQTGLLVAAVYVVSAVAQPLMGSLTNRLGPHRVFYGGLVIVMAAGLIGGFATSFTHLLIARGLIGLGTSSAVPAAMVLLRGRAEALGAGTPTRQLATLAAAGNVMAAAGLPIGGLLVSLFGWRAVFFVNVPVAVAAVALGLLFVPRGTRHPVPEVPLPRFDLAGVLLFTVTIGALGAFLNDVRHPIWWLLAASLAAGVVLAGWESRLARSGTAAPFIDVRLIAHAPMLRAVYLRSFVLSTAVYSMLYGLSQWFEVSRGLDAALVGVAMLPQSGASALAATLAGRTRNFRLLVTSVAGLFAVAAAALVLTSMTASLAAAVVASTFVGVAFGVGMVGNQGELYEASTAEQFGVASGLWRTSSYVGGFMAMAVMGLVYSSGVNDTGLAWFAGVIALCGLATVVPRRLVLPASDGSVRA